MKDNFIKSLVRRTLFRSGSVRRIRFGSLSGAVYRVSDITGMAPWYSGPEREHQRLFASILGSGDVAIDVGANWGMHTLLMSRLVGEQGRLVAVEPAPDVADELRWHLEANDCRNCELQQCAVSDYVGEATFVASQSAYTGHLVAGGEQGLQVPVTTLDQLVSDQKIEKIRLIKIDVEGEEGAVLRGARRILTEIRPAFIVDLHTPEQDVLVSRIFREARYSIKRVDGSTIKHLDRGWPDADGVWGSVVAQPDAV